MVDNDIHESTILHDDDVDDVDDINDNNNENNNNQDPLPSGPVEPTLPVPATAHGWMKMERNLPSISSILWDRTQQLWKQYRSLVQTHHVPLEMMDEIIGRCLFWAPYHETSGPWREVVYGLLSLHRMAMDCAQEEERIENSYGTTIQYNHHQHHHHQRPFIPATAIRIVLTSINCLVPCVLELVGSHHNQHNASRRNRQRSQAKARLILERLKFGLRLMLLVSYWKQSGQQSKTGRTLGILQEGGTFHVGQSKGLTVDQASALERRQSYVGRRTGRRVVQKPPLQQQHFHPSSRQAVMAAELLYFLRPLYWAKAEAKHSIYPNITRKEEDDEEEEEDCPTNSWPLLKAWMVTIGMDLISLELLKPNNYNPLSQVEWKRRRMKLFLYLLRSPIWDRLTSPTLEVCSRVTQCIPLVGRLIEHYLWDVILYWKHPYISEEG